MAGKSNIEWTGVHLESDCRLQRQVAGLCKHCYAMPMAARLEAMGQELYKGLTDKTKAGPGLQRHRAPSRRARPAMSDLFHENVPDEWIDEIFAVMESCPQHTFQVVTKRARRMREYCAHHAGVWCPQFGRSKPLLSNEIILDSRAGRQGPLPNVWLGVSTERQQEANERIQELLRTPAAVRFISYEPALGPLTLHPSWLPCPSCHGRGYHLPNFAANYFVPCEACVTLARAAGITVLPGQQATPGPRLDWVICGGESGKDARPMHPDWARELRDQCAAAGVPFFFKQWGEWAPDSADTGAGSDRDPIFEGKGRCAKFTDGRWEFSENGFTMPLGGDHEWMYRLGKKAAGRHLDGVLHDAMPQADGRGRG